MSIRNRNHCNRSQQPNLAEKMRSSRFDLVTSFLMSLMILLGGGVGVLLVIWAMGTSEATANKPAQVSRISFATAGTPEAEAEFDVPTPSEIESLAEPTLEDTILEVSTIQVSGVISDAVSQNTAPQDTGTKSGDPRGTNESGVEPVNHEIPRFDRWNLTFQATTAASYARQLDTLGIELAVFGGGVSGVDCLTDLSGEPRHYRIDDPRNETRLYFSWLAQQSSRALIGYERQWLHAASIPTRDRHLVKFISAQLESELAAAELEYAHQHGVNSADAIAKTVFESRPSVDGSQFHVIRQRYKLHRD